ncbi:hypothetical protein SOPP22_03535 [Shewanella sp. OPT22]|nr:hypothetical protein SOPP22_03535 [Shewanella sp. OPT22]
MDVGLNSGVQDVRSEALGIYSIISETLSFVWAARDDARRDLLENLFLLGCGWKAHGVLKCEALF